VAEQLWRRVSERLRLRTQDVCGWLSEALDAVQLAAKVVRYSQQDDNDV